MRGDFISGYGLDAQRQDVLFVRIELRGVERDEQVASFRTFSDYTLHVFRLDGIGGLRHEFVGLQSRYLLLGGRQRVCGEFHGNQDVAFGHDASGTVSSDDVGRVLCEVEFSLEDPVSVGPGS